MDRDRERAKELAAQYMAKGDATGWFEQLYQEAERGESILPWADLEPTPGLVEFWETRHFPAQGKRALTVGCGLGDDAEQLAGWGFDSTAFDVAPTAIRACRDRFPSSQVHYAAADLFHPPPEWAGRFDFVFECNTIQALPLSLRATAIARVADFVSAGGQLLIIARARDVDEPADELPWPLTRVDLAGLTRCGLREISFEDYFDRQSPPVRRFRALYARG